jgi:hypothetical protein
LGDCFYDFELKVTKFSISIPLKCQSAIGRVARSLKTNYSAAAGGQSKKKPLPLVFTGQAQFTSDSHSIF